jgi:hypothetical protein
MKKLHTFQRTLFISISSCAKGLCAAGCARACAWCMCSVDIMQMRSGGRNASEEGPPPPRAFSKCFCRIPRTARSYTQSQIELRS